MTANPHPLRGPYNDRDAVELLAAQMLGMRLQIATVADVRNTDLSGQYGGIHVQALKNDFDLDPDSDADDNGTSVLIDGAGNHFIRAIDTPAGVVIADNFDTIAQAAEAAKGRLFIVPANAAPTFTLDSELDHHADYTALQGFSDDVAGWQFSPGSSVVLSAQGHQGAVDHLGTFNNAQGAQIKIKGSVAAEHPTLVGFVDATGVPGAWLITAELSSVDNIAVGDYFFSRHFDQSFPDDGTGLGPVPGACNHALYLGATQNAQASLTAGSSTLEFEDSLTGKISANYIALLLGSARYFTAIAGGGLSATLSSKMDIAIAGQVYWQCLHGSPGTITIADGTVTGDGTNGFDAFVDAGDILVAVGSDTQPTQYAQIASRASNNELALVQNIDAPAGTRYHVIKAVWRHEQVGRITAIDVGAKTVTYMNGSWAPFAPPVLGITGGEITICRNSLKVNAGATSGILVEAGGLSFENIVIEGIGSTGVGVRAYGRSQAATVNFGNVFGVIGFSIGAQFEAGSEAIGAFGPFFVRSTDACLVFEGGNSNNMDSVITHGGRFGVRGSAAYIYLSRFRASCHSNSAVRADVGFICWSDWPVVNDNQGDGLELINDSAGVHFVGGQCFLNALDGAQYEAVGAGRNSGMMFVLNGRYAINNYASLVEADFAMAGGNGVGGYYQSGGTLTAQRSGAVGNFGIAYQNDAGTMIIHDSNVESTFGGVYSGGETKAHRVLAQGSVNDFLPLPGGNIDAQSYYGEPQWGEPLNVLRNGGSIVHDGGPLLGFQIGGHDGVGLIELRAPNSPTGADAVLPVAGGNILAEDSVSVMTHKTYDTAGAGNVFKVDGTAISSVTGLGPVVVLADHPQISGPTLTNTPQVGIVGTQQGTLDFAGSTSGTIRVTGQAVASGTLTLPAATDTLMGRATADTVTNKSINASNNTITNLTAAMFASNVIDTDGTLSANSDTRLATQKATKTYVDQIIAAQDAMVFKGVIDCSASPNYPAADRGATYRVSVAGKIGGSSGVNVEVGDLLLCLTDATASGNQATVGTAWSIAQTNLDGAVIGPASVTSGNFAVFSGTSGKLIADGGSLASLAGTGLQATGGQLAIDNNVVTLSGSQTVTNKGFDASANFVTKLATSMFATNVIDTDSTFTANSDTRLATQKAIKSAFAAYAAPAGTLTGSTLAAGVTASSLTSVGTLAALTISGDINVHGNTLQTENGKVWVTNEINGGRPGTAATLYIGYSSNTNDLDFQQGKVLFSGSGGAVFGSATGGAKGAGTINLAGDIYKNNTAYTNPDYVFEHYYKGRIVRFAKRDGAAGYGGLMPLKDLRRYTRSELRLPGIGDGATGVFERTDTALAKIEEAHLYILDLHEETERQHALLATFGKRMAALERSRGRSISTGERR